MDAVISHAAAGALWQLPGFTADEIEVSLLEARRGGFGGCRVHRPKSLERIDITRIDGIPVTTPARTLIDLAGSIAVDRLEEVLDDALRRRLVTVSVLRSRLRQMGTRGRDGSGRLDLLLSKRDAAESVPQSVFETRLLRVMRRAGLPKPSVQYEVDIGNGIAVLDLAYVDHKIAIEADGFRWHSSRRQWDHDRRRRTKLTKLGWAVVHVTWPQLDERPDEVIVDIRETLRMRRGTTEQL